MRNRIDTIEKNDGNNRKYFLDFDKKFKKIIHSLDILGDA
jgi:hypothetical protein